MSIQERRSDMLTHGAAISSQLRITSFRILIGTGICCKWQWEAFEIMFEFRNNTIRTLTHRRDHPRARLSAQERPTTKARKNQNRRVSLHILSNKMGRF